MDLKKKQNTKKSGISLRKSTDHTTSQISPKPSVNNNNPSNPRPSATNRNPLKIFLVVAAILILLVLGFVFIMHRCDGNGSEEPFDDMYYIPTVPDSVAYDTIIEYYQSTDPGIEDQSNGTPDNTRFGGAEGQTQNSEAKKKPIDPRFQNPDGTYKQPWEYSEYFDDDEGDDYEEGYEDGYDDALDEF